MSESRTMKRVQVVLHDAGGGHRNAAVALQAVIAAQQRPWQVELVHMQEFLDSLDLLKRLTGIRIQECYNALLRHGWTLGSTQLLRVLQSTIWLYHCPTVKRLAAYWREHPADLLVSVIPHFNRALCESWRMVNGDKPFVTLLTDLADFPPHFWIERQEQHLICGTQRAVEQARALGHAPGRIHQTSGMILQPDFYSQEVADTAALRTEMGLDKELPTGLVLFGGHGSQAMYDITKRLDASGLPVQLILICGRNEALAARLRARTWRMPAHIIGFTKEVHRVMRAADFLIGKPGPGSISEAMACGLPVIVECNAWILPQERYNAEWVKEMRVGLVLRSFRHIVEAVSEFLKPESLSAYRIRARELENRAVFEIPEILNRLLTEAGQNIAPPGKEPPNRIRSAALA